MDVIMMVAGLASCCWAAARGLCAVAWVFATRMRLPMAVVGAVVLGFGTSMPELLTSLSAALPVRRGSRWATSWAPTSPTSC
jgi:cation:H+ antiporter